MPKDHLKFENSPYLIQHAHNPVCWYPWGDEAISIAQKENKPIFLSIGYSTCHWCHVMAHQSFEDVNTAEIMNKHFINIKVDREEHPDLDKLYQLSHQLLNGQNGGWPLNLFLDPKTLIPFFSGTYFPKDPHEGLPPFAQILEHVARYFKHSQQALLPQSDQIKTALTALNHRFIQQEDPLNTNICERAYKECSEQFDTKYGGFSTAPKFYNTTLMDFLLTYAQDAKEPHAMKMVTFTLEKMGQSGIFDQLGGGFFRYSIDDRWEIPHFEKMLYDNTLLIKLYARAYKLTRNPLFSEIAIQSINWAIKKMRLSNTGFQSALDADSAGQEGRFYIWDQEELKQLLAEDEYLVFSHYYTLNKPANFNQHWHLHCTQNIVDVAHDLKMDISATKTILDNAREKAFQERRLRLRPHLDNKMICSWNALMVSALLELNHPEFDYIALELIHFIKNNFWVDGNLFTIHIQDKSTIPAMLDDYAFLLQATLDTLQYHFDSELLDFACQLADEMIHEFYDHEHAGFFQSASKNDEHIFHRLKIMSDDQLPAGNNIAISSLMRLGLLLTNNKYIEYAEKTLNAAIPAMHLYPSSYGSLLSVMMNYLHKPMTVTLRGTEAYLSEWLHELRKLDLPHCQIYAISDRIKLTHENLKTKKVNGNCIAYICHGTKCQEPISNLQALLLEIKKEQ